jgi:hypothetical protein
MDPERATLLRRTVVICGVGAVVFYAVTHPGNFALPSLTGQPTKTEPKKEEEPGSGWYARIYCTERTPTCGVKDGTILEIPVSTMNSNLPMSDRDKCEAFARIVVMRVNEHAIVTVDCIQSREAAERKTAESKPVQKPAQKQPTQPIRPVRQAH